MTTARHLASRAFYLVTCLAFGLFVLGPLVAPSSPAPVAVANCTADPTVMVNTCLTSADLDHTQVADFSDSKIVDGTVREAVWQCLLDAGYHGDPTDGDEAIYAPDSAIDACIAQVVYPPLDGVWQCVRDAGYPGDPFDESFYAPDSVINGCIAQNGSV